MGDVVLLSGGIDSLVCAEMSRQAGTLDLCVFVDYGHPAQIPEGWKSFAYCGSRGVSLKAVHAFGLDLGDMQKEAGARVVRSRNAVLLALAANSAPGRLIIGANADDARDYPDCRPAFLAAMGVALGREVVAPLVTRSKPWIIERARALGLSQEDAWSCYGPGPSECGECPSCIESENAWAAGLALTCAACWWWV